MDSLSTEHTGNYKILSLLTIPYIISVGIGWALGYWRSFGINPFEYAGPAEIASLSAYALGASMSTLAISFLLLRMFLDGPHGRGFDNWIGKWVKEKMGPNPGPVPREGSDSETLTIYQNKLSAFERKLRRAEKKLFLFRFGFVMASFMAAYFAYVTQSPFWLGAFAVSPVMALVVADPIPEWIKAILPKGSSADIVLCFMIGFPIVAFLFGAQGAYRVKEGKGDLILYGIEEKAAQRGSVYVGRLGTYLFTYDVCGERVNVRKDNELKSFSLVPNAMADCSESSEAQQKDPADGIKAVVHE